MRRTALVLAAALWASAAHAQQSVHPKNVQGGVAAQPVQDTVCIVKGEWVKPCADPQSELLARLAKAPARAQVMHAVFKPHVIYTDVGGRISEYLRKSVSTPSTRSSGACTAMSAPPVSASRPGARNW